MDIDIFTVKKRGRPLGHRLSQATKEKIREKRLGTYHSQATKDKISKSLTLYFKRRDSLADSIQEEYECFPEEISNWVCENKEEIDDSKHVMTNRRLAHLNQLELCFGYDIEYLFGHNTTPEFLLLLKEELPDKDFIKELHSLL